VVPTKEVPELAITREGAWAAWAINPEEKANIAKVVMEVRVLRNLAMVIPSSEHFRARGISLIHTLLPLMGTLRYWNSLLIDFRYSQFQARSRLRKRFH
jgi:hypothetical protein